VCALSDVKGFGGAMHPSITHAPQVVGIDFKAHRVKPTGTSVIGTTRSQCFSQHHVQAPVQQAKGLMGLGIDRHLGANRVFTHFGKDNAKVIHSGLEVRAREDVNRDGFLPNGHDGRETR